MVKYPKKFLQDLLYDDNEFASLISDDIIDHRRWSVVHRIVFEHKSSFYETTYSTGATEAQDEHPWEYEDEVECFEVVPTEVRQTIYVRR
jgi:hypothetical protein